MTKRDIIDRMARCHMVEDIVRNISGRDVLQASLCDLAQDVYCVILDYDTGKILHLWESGAMPFFVARIVMNQYNSRRSPYYYKYKRLLDISKPIDEQDAYV